MKKLRFFNFRRLGASGSLIGKIRAIEVVPEPFLVRLYLLVFLPDHPVPSRPAEHLRWK